MASVDVVIVNYNSAEYLKKCLKSIHDNLNRTNINIFVEDNSCEREIELIKAQFPKIRFSQNRTNLGFAKAVNRGIKKGNAPYILIINPDTVLLNGFFESALAYMEKNPDVGVLGPKILNADGTIQGSARSFPTPLTAFFGRSSLMTRLFPRNRFTRQNLLTIASDGTRPMGVDWVSGACMLVRRKAIDDVGYLDEQFFMYWEDADWCRRMKEAGWRVVYFPSASIVHYTGVSSEQLIFRSILEFHRSSYLLFSKYSKNAWKLLKPVILGGLAARFICVLSSNLVRVWRAKVPGPLRDFVTRSDRNGKIKILRVISRLNIGGPAIHVHLLSTGLDQRKFESLLITGRISPEEGDMSYLFEGTNGKVITIPQLQREIDLKSDIKAVLKILSIIRQQQPHIIHSHTAKAGFGSRIAALICRTFCGMDVKTVHTFHGHVFQGYFDKWRSASYAWIERLLAKITDAVIVISERQRMELVETFRIAPSHKARIIELGFDLAPFLNCGSLRGKFRDQMGLSDDKFLIGIIGRLVPIKNHIMFLKAAKMLIGSGFGGKTKFLIIGDGELREQLQGYCVKEGLNGNVIFCGWVKDVPYVYADLNLVTLTSLSEGTPVSIIEAMASSVPVIATQVGGVPDLLGSARSHIEAEGFVVCERGIICQKDDAVGFASAMRYVMKENKEDQGQRALAAKSFVEEKYSKTRLIKDIESLYIELAGRG